MNQELHNIERFDKYINDKMDEAELAEFEKELEENKELADDLAVFLDIREGVEAIGDKELESKIKAIDKKLDRDNFFSEPTSKIIKMKSTKSIWRRPLAIAASLAVLLTAGYFLFSPTNNNQQNLAATFEKFKQPETTATSEILDKLEASGFADDNKSKQDSLAAALTLYEQGAYKKAISYVNQYLKTYPEDKVAKLYLGLSLLQDEEYGKAAKHLMPLAELDDFEQQEVAKWYLALCYTTFKSESADKHAKRIFQELLSSSRPEYVRGSKAFLQLMR